jgi:HAD superfamily hydrolase (TIGR01509 family)
MLSALLFDLDGTLANTDPLHYQTWQEILQEYGLEIDRPFYQQHFSGRRNLEIIQDLLPHLASDEAEALSQFKEAEFRKRSHKLPPLPGLLELLTWVEQQQLPKAVVTNAPRKNAEFMLRSLNLEATFPVVILGDELAMGKPDPLPYQLGMSRLGVLPEQAIAFEDSPSGLRSAVSAGILTVGIASTHNSKDLYELGAMLVVEDFTDPQLMQLLLWKQNHSETHPPAECFSTRTH